eukprot:m.146691 g.146691  ORF g.146691 m.146691 type:complete len:75 (+) comp16245_c0_seq6:2667-2891(+)
MTTLYTRAKSTPSEQIHLTQPSLLCSLYLNSSWEAMTFRKVKVCTARPIVQAHLDWQVLKLVEPGSQDGEDDGR